MGFRGSKMTFYELCISFEKSQCKISRHSGHEDISPHSHSRIWPQEYDSRIE